MTARGAHSNTSRLSGSGTPRSRTLPFPPSSSSSQPQPAAAVAPNSARVMTSRLHHTSRKSPESARGLRPTSPSPLSKGNSILNSSSSPPILFPQKSVAGRREAPTPRLVPTAAAVEAVPSPRPLLRRSPSTLSTTSSTEGGESIVSRPQTKIPRLQL